MGRRVSVSVFWGSVLLSLFVLVSGCKKSEQPLVEVKKAEGKKGRVVAVHTDFSFEDGTSKWTPRSKSIKLETSAGKKHGGNMSLEITGNAVPATWNYALSPKFALEPGKNYRLTGWMLVEAINPSGYKPFFKIGIDENTKPPKFIKNFNTTKYDLDRKGEWQELSADFSAPAESDIYGYLAVEKGIDKDAIEATIYIDDIKLEVME